MATTAEAKLIRQTKFPPEFAKKVDMQKVNIEVMKKWIAGKISGILGNEDDVVIELCFNLLEGARFIQLTGFLDKDTPKFCKELWNLCLSAQTNPQGVPKELLEAKKLELRQEKVLESERLAEEARRRREEERAREQMLAHHHGGEVWRDTETALVGARQIPGLLLGVEVHAGQKIVAVVRLGQYPDLYRDRPHAHRSLRLPIEGTVAVTDPPGVDDRQVTLVHQTRGAAKGEDGVAPTMMIFVQGLVLSVDQIAHVLPEDAGENRPPLPLGAPPALFHQELAVTAATPRQYLAPRPRRATGRAHDRRPE
ncbi:hypothetical protein RJZ56_000305 [Blastomyces dermatitidis]